MTRFNKQSGLTLVEILLVVSVIGILITVTVLLTNPVYFKSKARDQKRISDLKLLERIIIEYRVDNGAYPDTASVTRQSNLLPSGRTSLSDPRSGWIVANLIEYNTRLPVDPINNATYYYQYRHANDQYELDAKLEAQTSMMTSDQGNDAYQYEIGTNITLINP